MTSGQFWSAVILFILVGAVLGGGAVGLVWWLV